ncbi:T-cell surface glycoprotein CD3 epsilon chain [Larimichthys crocea]|uniref:T-cell surface glycoprotein CD3 epsilon chain n=1 Tax=Larimichthys crocea TaxID=215358 RepID=UPI000F5E06B5|nr:T-cell surface glycoprotein CD3 epsilon chain [Larimichthys crocea]
MTCPESGTWYYKDKISDSNTTLTITYGNDKKGLYYCEYDSDKKYYFFVQGKVCENCFELNAALFGVVIVMDVALTAVVMIIIFMCTKKKNPAGLAHPPKTPARPERRGPPGQSSEYEQLNHTRSQDTYSIVNRTG